MFSPFGGLPAEEVDAALSEYAKTLPKDERKGFKERFWETNIGGLLQSIAGAVTLPGDVYAGKVDPMSDEAIGRSFELAGLLNVGSGAVPAKPNELRAGIKAYHGSPHDFDRFDLSKIGTGEGAQAYGHGLYFAENEKVANAYKGLQGRASVDPMSNVAAKQLASYGDTPGMREMMKLIFPDASQDQVEMAIATAKRPPTGRMYEVELQTSPERLLDWDKPLSQQPDSVKNAIADHQRIQRVQIGDDATGAELLKELSGTARNGRIFSPSGSVISGKPEIAATEYLRQRGVDGVKYLDAGSRGVGQGSSNYVMFDDKFVKVLRKYGVATLAALPAAGLFELGLTPEDVQQVN